MLKLIVVTAGTAALGFSAVLAQPPAPPKKQHGVAQSHDASAAITATAELKTPQASVGRVELTESPKGVLLAISLNGAPAGEHAFHVHEVGKCDPPTFESAGEHFDLRGAQHGFFNVKGPHAGDLPNVHVSPGGQLQFEYFVAGVTLKPGARSLLDANGSAVVLHAKPDDYRTDPSGDAGDRVACGVIEKK